MLKWLDRALLYGLTGALLLGVTWDSSFEGTPGAGDLVSNTPTFIRNHKVGVRERLQLDHDFGTGVQTIPAAACDPDGAGTCQNDGSHLAGSARAYFQAAAPTNRPGVDATGAADPLSTTSGHDDGRIWVDSDTGRASVWDDDTPGGAGFRPVVGMPANAIILWDQSTGDENCDGTASAVAGDRCPCGFTEATEFAGIYARGADSVSSSSDVPEEVGTICDNTFGGSVDANCDADDEHYDDVGDSTELIAHEHDISGQAGGGGNPFVDTSGDSTVINAVSGVVLEEGVASPVHYHPFRTVVFCRATG